MSSFSTQELSKVIKEALSTFSERDFSLIRQALSNPETKQGLVNYAGNIFQRHMGGRCQVCNDLRADGHELSLGEKRGLLDDHVDYSEEYKAAHEEAIALGPSLELEDIPMKDILKCRMKNEEGEFLSTCVYCRFICDIVDEIFPYHRAVWEARMERGTMRGKVNLLIRQNRPLVIRCQGNNFEVDVEWAQYRVDIEVYHDKDEPPESTLRCAEVLPHCGPASPIPISSNSSESQTFLERHYQQCLAEHSACRAAAPIPARLARHGSDFAPTRLLRVTDNQVRLVDCWEEGDTVSWVALSHCWGRSTIITLKRDSLEAMKEGVNWDDLPPTFQNAITVTRRLGIECIWIDSLCIVQDDLEDWEREASEMTDIYGCAALVLSAGMSRTPYEPFLCERDDKWHSKIVQLYPSEGSPVPFRIRRRVVLTTRLSQGLNEPPYTSDWASLRRTGPLYKRSWTFQETFLAIRAAHFKPGGLVFECKTHRVLEGALPPYPSTAENTLGDVPVARKWQLIVKAYSYRDLTFPKDRLPAISGIAAKLHRHTKDQYVAGLWASSLASDLLWHAMPGAEEIGIAYPNRPYIGPSWSWASLRREVVWNLYRNLDLLATVVEYVSSPRGSNAFGEVKMALLLMKGRLLRCRVRWDYKADEYLAYFHRADGSKSEEQWFPADGLLLATETRESDGNDGPMLSNIRRARIGEASPRKDFDTEAIFLCIGKTSLLDFDHVGLILGQSSWCPNLREYSPLERIGSISNLPQEWYDAGEEQTVLLV